MPGRRCARLSVGVCRYMREYPARPTTGTSAASAQGCTSRLRRNLLSCALPAAAENQRQHRFQDFLRRVSLQKIISADPHKCVCVYVCECVCMWGDGVCMYLCMCLYLL